MNILGGIHDREVHGGSGRHVCAKGYSCFTGFRRDTRGGGSVRHSLFRSSRFPLPTSPFPVPRPPSPFPLDGSHLKMIVSGKPARGGQAQRANASSSSTSTGIGGGSPFHEVRRSPRTRGRASPMYAVCASIASKQCHCRWQ